MDTDHWESQDALLKLARDRGYDVTKTQLVAWHRAGLLPKPKQRGLGRDRGSHTVYPPGAEERLLRVCEIHFDARVKLFNHIGWLMWWEGYDDGSLLQLVRAYLTKIVTNLDKDLRVLLDPVTGLPNEDEWERKLKESRDSRLQAPVSRMRRRVKRDRMPMLISLMLEIPSGLYQTFQIGAVEGSAEDDSDSSLVERALGLDRGPDSQTSESAMRLAEGLEITLGEGSQLFREHTLSEVIEVAGDEELRASRDQVRLMLASIRMIGALAEEMPGSEAVALQEMSKDLSDLKPSDQALLVLSWAMWRLWGPPGTRQMMDSHHEELHQALNQIMEVGWNPTDTDKK